MCSELYVPTFVPHSPWCQHMHFCTWSGIVDVGKMIGLILTWPFKTKCVSNPEGFLLAGSWHRHTDLWPAERKGYCGGRTERLGKEDEGGGIISSLTAVLVYAKCGWNQNSRLARATGGKYGESQLLQLPPRKTEQRTQKARAAGRLVGPVPRVWGWIPPRHQNVSVWLWL